MNEKEIIHLMQREEEKLHEGVCSFSEYLIICARIDTLKDQLIEVISSKKTMKKTKKPAKKKAAAKKKVVAKKTTRKVSKKK